MRKSFGFYSQAAFLLTAICLTLGCSGGAPEAEPSANAAPVAAPVNALPYYLDLTGTPYEIGLEHGRRLKLQVHQAIDLWKYRLSKVYSVDPDTLIALFLARTDYLSAIREYTPDLLEEVKGIAEGAEMDFNSVLAFQYLDETGLNSRDLLQDKCSGLGVDRRGDTPAMMAQNMDLEGFRNGYQTVLRIHRPDGLEVMSFTCAGLIATNGLNNRGVGVCVNALTQLDHKLTGLPVAFVIRGLLDQPDQAAAVEFLKRVQHASGQNYIIGGPDSILSFECSPAGPVEYSPERRDGAIAHTNHPFACRDFSPAYRKALAENDSSHTRDIDSEIRFQTVTGMLEKRAGQVDVDWIKAILSSTVNPEHPVSCKYKGSLHNHTFGSTVMVLGPEPELFVSPGPPTVDSYVRFRFTADGR